MKWMDARVTLLIDVLGADPFLRSKSDTRKAFALDLYRQAPVWIDCGLHDRMRDVYPIEQIHGFEDPTATVIAHRKFLEMNFVHLFEESFAAIAKEKEKPARNKEWKEKGMLFPGKEKLDITNNILKLPAKNPPVSDGKVVDVPKTGTREKLVGEKRKINFPDELRKRARR